MGDSRSIPDLTLENVLIYLRDISLGKSPTESFSSKFKASKDIQSIIPAFSKLGFLHDSLYPHSEPEYDVPATRIPSAINNRLLCNAELAKTILLWPEWVVTAATLRARQLYIVERLVSTRDFSNNHVKEGSSFLSPWTSVTVENLVSRVLSAVGASIELLPSLDRDLHSFDSFVGETDDALTTLKLSQFLDVVQVTNLGGATSAMGLILASKACAKTIARFPSNPMSASLAALLGICVSVAPCENSATALWLTWIATIRGLVQSLETTCTCNLRKTNACQQEPSLAREAVGKMRYNPHPSCSTHRSLSLLCIAPFKGSSDFGPGRHASRALSALASHETIFSYFAMLKIGLDPGMGALATKPIAFDFVATAISLAPGISRAILQFLHSLLDI